MAITQQDIDTARKGLEFSGNSLKPHTVSETMVRTVAAMIAAERERVLDAVQAEQDGYLHDGDQYDEDI